MISVLIWLGIIVSWDKAICINWLLHFLLSVLRYSAFDLPYSQLLCKLTQLISAGSQGV